MPFVGTLFIILLFSYFVGRVAEKFHFSKVIGLIVAGMLLSLPILRDQLIIGHEVTLGIFANAGLLALMFLSGFEISGNIIFKEEKDAVVITISTIIVSLVLGTLVMLALGFSIETALIMGICFGITAEATKARVLIQLKKLNTKIGALMMGTGITNDAVGIAFFVFIIYFFTNQFSLEEVKILGGIIMAFLAGALVHWKFDRFTRKVRFIERIFLFALVPFFFVNMGFHFSLSLDHLNYKILLITIITAATGQMLGVFITRPITKLSVKQLYLVGWAMNSKGAVELAIAFIAFRLELLPPSLYSAIMIVTLVSTVLFQVIIFRMVKTNPAIMD